MLWEIVIALLNTKLTGCIESSVFQSDDSKTSVCLLLKYE